MKHSPLRRALLWAAASAPLIGSASAWSHAAQAASTQAARAQDRLDTLERESGGRLGVAVLNTRDGLRLQHRADERFAMCSTFKVMAAAAILKRSVADKNLLQRRIAYTADQLVTYSPVTEKQVGAGMTVAELCAAALQYSDNTAANFLIKLLGGLEGVTLFAREIGDEMFRLDRWETALNTAIPGDPRDTSTPAAMMKSVQLLMLGNALAGHERSMLVTWMRGNTTGDKRIRANVPEGWSVADKTGSGDYGTANDVGVLWPPGKSPIVLALYFTQAEKGARLREDVLASATKIVVEALG
jgi:beta-lactamase class A